jgi:hypothetical protein
VDGVRVFGIIVRGGGLGDVDVKELMIPVVIRGRSSLGKGAVSGWWRRGGQFRGNRCEQFSSMVYC